MVTNLLNKVTDEFFFNERYQRRISLAINQSTNKTTKISKQIDLVDELIVNVQKHIGYGNLKHALRLILVLNQTLENLKKQLDSMNLLTRII